MSTQDAILTDHFKKVALGRLMDGDAMANESRPKDRPSEAAAELRERSQRIAALFEAHNRALVRFLTCRLQSSQDAMEIAQEAYVRLLRLDETDGISYLRAFLFKTAANLASDRIKNESRRGRLDRMEFFDDSLSVPSSEHNVLAEQELHALVQVVQELPAKCREAFILHNLLDYSFQEVAAQMNLSERMIRLYVERALVYCRDRLEELSSPSSDLK